LKLRSDARHGFFVCSPEAFEGFGQGRDPIGFAVSGATRRVSGKVHTNVFENGSWDVVPGKLDFPEVPVVVQKIEQEVGTVRGDPVPSKVW
jgi:hypothetical protein